MPPTSADEAAYRDQLDRYATDLAAGRVEQVLPDLVVGSGRGDVERYVENAVLERFRMLVEDTRLVALATPDIEPLVLEYLRLFPRQTFELGRREAPAFLFWLSRTRKLTTRQADFVAFQQAEYACLTLAGNRQAEYRQFRRLLAASDPRSIGPSTQLTLNPARVWSRLSGFALGERTAELRPVLFAPQGEQICHHALDDAQRLCLGRLEDAAPTTLADWTGLCGMAPSMARELAVRLLEKEIVAAW